MILEHIQKIQRANQIEPSNHLEGKYNLTIEMETGVGKTYTYIKTMYELNKQYGWSKFIIVVPNIAIREGVYKSFQVTQEHFAEEYGKKIRFFIYNSTQLMEIDRFASDSSINVMIINSQAFNARGKDARRIYMKLDEFRSRRPIDIIAKTNPILIIDEPQSVEGKQTKENLKQFNPMITLRYSATHKSDSIYNMIYRLDAMEAYNKRLVKKIAVKGITESGSTATDSYVYLESINLSKAAPTATIQFDFKGASGMRKKTQTVGIGFNIYDHSGQLDEYKNGFVVKFIDGRDDSVEFINGIKIYAGDVIGKVTEEQLRRIQIRETILSHIQRERQLFYKGIKVLSLFFIDEVDHYKCYDDAGQPYNGIFADMFEEEYRDIVGTIQKEIGDDDYKKYLEAIPSDRTHAGYFSIDKKGHMSNSKIKDKKERTSDDIDAYDLIMKNKELFVDRVVKDDNGNEFLITSDVASEIQFQLRVMGYIDKMGVLTDKYYEDKANGEIKVAEEVQDYASDVIGIIDSIYDSKALMPDNARSNNVELTCDEEKLNSKEFKALWTRINSKSVYVVDFDTDELVKKAIAALNSKLRVSKIYFKVETGQMNEIKSKQDLLSGASFVREESGMYGNATQISVNRGVKYDLVGKLVDETGLTRKAIIQILAGIEKNVFDQFKHNPEEFIIKAAALINDEKATAIIEHITYDVTDAKYDTDIFTEPTIKGKMGTNAMKANKHLYDHIVYDSTNEKAFAEKLDTSNDVAVYVKLPDGFYISTPVGKYNPDWAIAFHEGNIKYIYFVAETKGSMSSMQLNLFAFLNSILKWNLGMQTSKMNFL